MFYFRITSSKIFRDLRPLLAPHNEKSNMTKLTINQALQQAIEAHKAGQIQEADRLYTTILEAQPKHPDANHNMGVLAVGVGKFEQALLFFKTALEANPATAQFWLSYIDTLIKLEQLADAKAVLDQAKSKGAKGDGFDELEKRLQEAYQEPLVANQIASEPQSEQPNILDTLKLDQAISLAKKNAKEGSHNEAKRIYQDILTKFPKNKRASDGLKRLVVRPNGKASKVQDPPQYQLQSLINLYSQGQNQQALEQIEILIKQFPTSAILLNIQGAAFKAQGQIERAIDAYQKAIKIKPDYAHAMNNMGITLKDQGMLEEAIEIYNKVLIIEPDNAQAYNNIGIALAKQWKPEQAVKAYKKAVALKPDYATAYFAMGHALKEQGKLNAAIKMFKKAIDVKPDYSDTYNDLAITLNEKGKLKEAVAVCNQVLALKPNSAQAYNTKGVVLKAQGKLEEAIEAYNKALAIEPDCAESIGNLTSLQTQLQNKQLFGSALLKHTYEAYDMAMVNRPKFLVIKAISSFLSANQTKALAYLKHFETCSTETISKLSAGNYIFCNTYSKYLDKLLKEPIHVFDDFNTSNLIYHIGESHCLSFAHHDVEINRNNYRIKPMITFGAKAFHFSKIANNAFKAITKANLHYIPKHSKVFLSFGEIDCRFNEGFISAAAKLDQTIESLIASTIAGYLKWFCYQNETLHHSMHFFNVPAPMYDQTLSSDINTEVAKTVVLFNNQLEKQVGDLGLNLVNVYRITNDKDGFSSGHYHIDSKHLGKKAIPKIQEQLRN